MRLALTAACLLCIVHHAQASTQIGGIANRQLVREHRAELMRGIVPEIIKRANEPVLVTGSEMNAGEWMPYMSAIRDGAPAENAQAIEPSSQDDELPTSHHEGMWSRKQMHRRLAERQQARALSGNGTEISPLAHQTPAENTSSSFTQSSSSATSASTTTATSSPSTTPPKSASASLPSATSPDYSESGISSTVAVSQTSTASPSSSPSSLSSSSSPSTTTTMPSVHRIAATTTTKTTPVVCAPTYRAPTMISGTGTLPKPTSFVKRMPTGWGLGLDGKSFRIAGYNIYWLCNHEDELPKGQNPSKQRVREAMAMAVAAGANTIRVTTCGQSTGTLWSIEPSVGRFRNWDAPDYVLYAAREYGLRVILPLTDNYNYYHGGKYDFLWWKKISTINNGWRFYTENTAIASYKAYIYQMMNRVNKYTGVRYGDDPTILAWETGNELGAYLGTQGYPPLKWTNNIAAYIKSMSNQLVIDGSDGFYSWSTRQTAEGLKSPYIDIMTDHSYPRNITLLDQEVKLIKQYNKNFLIGEWDWTNNNGGNSIDQYIQRLESSYFFGDMVWSLFGHDDNCCAYLPHVSFDPLPLSRLRFIDTSHDRQNDGYTIYYPNGNTASEQDNILKVVQHFYRQAS
ncbi:hypothetical protein OIV83_003273 [Microbotryomycetes sp. JL201]|nr:hypothetical protein OIV83_003273 [Microbotryomycetes sp. JL201]